MKWKAWLVSIGLVVASMGCGYSLAGKGDFLPDHIKVVAIPQFLNLTPQPEVEELFTYKVVEEFNSRGKYIIRPDLVGADAVLNGKLTALILQPAVLQGGEDQQTANQASRYTIIIRAEVVFTDLIDQQVIWSDTTFSFREEYEIGEDPEQFFDQSGMAFTRMAEEFSKTLVSRILEAF
jgi:hypothetical protein